METWLLKYRGYLILSLVYASILGAVLLWRRPAPAPTVVIVEPDPSPTPTPSLVVVYVSGAVLRPDVYALSENSRLKDALLAAGGPLPTADISALNLATALHDGQRVHVPAQGEAPPSAPAASAAPIAATGAASAPPAPGPINVNTASATELEALPGIGTVLAQRIIEDRQANGPYESVDDLIRVRGIGPAMLERLRPLVTVQ